VRGPVPVTTTDDLSIPAARRPPRPAGRTAPVDVPRPRQPEADPAPSPAGRWEKAASAHCEAIQAHVAAGGRASGYVLRRPWRAAALVHAISRLPRLRAELSRSAEGHDVAYALRTGRVPLGPLTHKSVLVLPPCGTDFATGPSKQQLRWRIRKATRLGVRWKLVDSPEERREVLDHAVAWERTHSDLRYRHEHAEHDDLLPVGLWLVAYRGEPAEYLVVAVVPVDGQWAHLSHYRTIGEGLAQTEGRFLLMAGLAETLAARGVRYLVDGRGPAGLPNGLRRFQRVVGFRIHRVRARVVSR
jgi:hypothetical protein